MGLAKIISPFSVKGAILSGFFPRSPVTFRPRSLCYSQTGGASFFLLVNIGCEFSKSVLNKKIRAKQPAAEF
jgi:hypothetical protein